MRLKSNLPFTAKRDYSRTLKAPLIPVYFNRYKGRKSLFFISKCSGDIIISFMEVYAIFCTRQGFTKVFAMSLDFADVKNSENMSKGMTYRTYFFFNVPTNKRFTMQKQIQEYLQSVWILIRPDV